MAQTFEQLPSDAANAGKKLDAFATSGTGNLRQALVLGDPTTDAAVATVTAANGVQVDPTRMPTTASAPTIARVASSASNVTLQAANANRRGLRIYNESTAILYVKLGTTASVTSYSFQMLPQAYYEHPAEAAMYTGNVDGIWASVNGFA